MKLNGIELAIVNVLRNGNGTMRSIGNAGLTAIQLRLILARLEEKGAISIHYKEEPKSWNEQLSNACYTVLLKKDEEYVY